MKAYHTPTALFAQPFRIFFLSVALWAVIVIPVWVWMLHGHSLHRLTLPLMDWHRHEMVFGLTLPAFAGFLLTASAEWTKTDPLDGAPLAALWVLWIAGRLTVCHGADLPWWLPAAINLAFVPAFMSDVLARVVRTRAWVMTPMLVMVALFWAAQWQLWGVSFAPSIAAATLIVGALMMVIGGKITMTFGKAWLARERKPDDTIRDPRPLLALMVLLFLVLYALLSLSKAGAWRDISIAVIALLTGVICCVRLACWRAWIIRHEVNVLQLTLGLLWVPISLFLLAGWKLGIASNTAWLHALSVGGMGTLLLAVMSRVPLAHTGRSMELSTAANLAYWMMHAAAIVRVSTAMGWISWRPGITATGVLWCIAFSAYAISYLAVFTEPLPHSDAASLAAWSQAPECEYDEM